MGKQRGRFYFSEPGEKKHEAGLKAEITQVLAKFGRENLDKMFESWLLIGKNNDVRKFTEVEGGDLLSGMILCNPGDDVRGNVKNERASMAMLMLDAAESICEDEETTENFLEALWRTSKRLHGQDKNRWEYNKGNLTDTEEMKVEVLKSFMNVCMDMFDTYEGKYRFAMSIIGAVIPALLLDKGDAKTRRQVREDMKASVKNGEMEKNRLAKVIRNATKIADDALDMIDDGMSLSEVTDMFKEHFKFD